jgi:hypothetical protein
VFPQTWDLPLLRSQLFPMGTRTVAVKWLALEMGGVAGVMPLAGQAARYVHVDLESEDDLVQNLKAVPAPHTMSCSAMTLK